jgi:energy-coupling factor transport system permease protein
VAATATILAAIALDGVACQLLLAALAVLLPAAVAGLLARLLRLALLLALPLVLSALVVNLLFLPGGSRTLLEVGPLRITGEGLDLALVVAARIVTMAGAATLFYLATRPAELVADLERRGVPPRLTFVLHNAVAMVPQVAERAADIAAAQRARGLDTEGSPWRRARGILPLAAPTIIGAIGEAEARTLALEARAFTRPGGRTLLWAPADRTRERVLRWLATGAVVALVIARLAGVPLPC